MLLDLSNKNLKKLPKDLPEGLQILSCYDNQITTLVGLNFLRNLLILSCWNNQITTLQGLNLPENLLNFDCSNNQITTLVGVKLPENLQILYCSDNQITHIANLPLGLTRFYYTGNPIEYVDNVKYDKINFTLKGYQAIRRIQLRMKRRFKIKNTASKIIGRHVLRWLWSPNGPCVKTMVKKMQEDGLLLN